MVKRSMEVQMDMTPATIALTALALILVVALMAGSAIVVNAGL